jgi:diacylglycerol kinase family enzyme
MPGLRLVNPLSGDARPSVAALQDDGCPAKVEAAVDGEPAMLEPPFEFTIEPRALRVLVPPRRQDSVD